MASENSHPSYSATSARTKRVEKSPPHQTRREAHALLYLGAPRQFPKNVHQSSSSFSFKNLSLSRGLAPTGITVKTHWGKPTSPRTAPLLTANPKHTATPPPLKVNQSSMPKTPLPRPTKQQQQRTLKKVGTSSRKLTLTQRQPGGNFHL